MINSYTQHTHCQVAQANRTSQNLAISMFLPTHKENETCSKVKIQNKKACA